MRIAVISDLHRCSLTNMDNFGLEKEKALVEFLKMVRKEYDFFMILGDKEELWQPIGQDADKLRRVYMRYWKSEKALEGLRDEKKIMTIAGNHDWYLKKLYGLNSVVAREWDTWDIIMMHGHQFDSGFVSKIGRTVTGLWGGVERLFGTDKALDWSEDLESIWVKLKDKKSVADDPDQDCIAKAIAFAKKAKFPAIVLGHTHQAKVKEIDGIVYANSGTWVGKKSDYLDIDTVKKTMTVRSW